MDSLKRHAEKLELDFLSITQLLAQGRTLS